MVNFTGVYVKPVRNGTLSKLASWSPLTGRHFSARGVVETSYKRNYFSWK